jgi:hypothetical protein
METPPNLQVYDLGHLGLVGFGFKAGLGVGLVAGLGLAWLWR